MNIAEIIGKLRDEKQPSADEISFMVEGITTGDVSDSQLGAFAMAILWRGLSDENGLRLTEAMRDSGDVFEWDIDGHIVDKHSTGGVGDCVSLALAPILAEAGLFVPMISGRGLGHTGGTLDKLEAIPGFSTQIPIYVAQDQLEDLGVVMMGQTSNLAPADKRFYAVRDVTGTVPSIDLITASILSKKLAEGLDDLVLDVKCGQGAFMRNFDDAQKLARRIVEVARMAGCNCRALITEMERPLCARAGNSLEVHEILDLLEGKLDTKLYTLTRALCAELMRSAGQEDTEAQVDQIVSSGRAMERFEQLVAAQGGPKRDIRGQLPAAPIVRDVVLDHEPFFGLNAYAVGMAVVELGGGRRHAHDLIDPAVGLAEIASGARKKGDRIAQIHAADENSLAQAEAAIMQAVLREPVDMPLIMERIE